MNGIGKEGLPNNRDAVSIWKVYIPSDVDRNNYVKTCYLTGSVSLINEYGEIKHRVKIGRLGLQLVTFPIDSKSFGSEVICLTAPYSGKLHVVDVFADPGEFFDQDENQFRFYKAGIGYAEVKIDSRGKILLTVDGEEQADVTISVTNKDRSGKLNVNVNGDIIVQNDGTTTVTSTNQILLEYKDKDGSTSASITKDEIKLISAKKILLNESEEPVLLGEKTTTFLSDLLDQLGKESAGPYPLRGASLYTQMKEKLEELKSEITFVK